MKIEETIVDGQLQLRGLGKFLYTENPFYLISCGLIIYGLQVATAGGDLHHQSKWLAACMAGYCVLMTVTVVAVVRVAKVWEDARSIFIVVMISHLAMSSGFDLLCLDSREAGARILGVGWLLSVVSTEFVLRGCSLKFPFWYRSAYYAVLLTFFTSPLICAWLVAKRETILAQWSGMLFSTAVAACLLMLVPAIRRGRPYVRRHGTPWTWPWYPLSLFVVLVVVAAIRAHGIWMSFGSFGVIRFEPILLLPLVWAVLVLAVELALRMRRSNWNHAWLVMAPLMLCLGTSNGGQTHMQVANQLEDCFGSAFSLSLLVLTSFYIYSWIRGLKHARVAAPLCVLLFGWAGDMPTFGNQLGLMHWMFSALAATWMIGIAIWSGAKEVTWLAVCIVLSSVGVQAGYELGQPRLGEVVAMICFLAGILLIGACFESPFAERLRQLAAVVASGASIVLVVGQLVERTSIETPTYLILAIVLCVVYAHQVRRVGWFYLAGFEAVLLIVILVASGEMPSQSLTRHWPLQSGIVCLVIGLTITSLKSGIYRPLASRIGRLAWLSGYRRGF